MTLTPTHGLNGKLVETPISTIELGRLIKQEPANIRRKAASLNGAVNFDPTVDAFDAGQLKAVLTAYLTGKRPLNDESKQAVESLLNGLVDDGQTPVESLIVKPLKAVEKVAVKPLNRQPQKPLKHVEWRERLENAGILMTVWLGSIPLLYAYFFLFIGGEAYIQADLLSRSTGIPTVYLFAGTFLTLALLVLLTINARFDETRLIEWRKWDGEKHLVRGLNGSTLAEIAFWGYNVLMCEARFFSGDEAIKTHTIVLAAAGLAIPTVIAICARTLKNRIKNLKF